MTAPLVIPTPGSSLTAVRYYTPLDPYYYTVDNRPIGDLDQNVQSVLTQPLAALFRSTAINAANSPLSLGALFQPGSAGCIKGLAVSNPATGSLSIAPGALFFRDQINSTTAITVVKQASLFLAQALAIPAPATTGHSINYLVQGKISYLDASSMPSSAFPFVDATNTSLPGLLPNAELKVSIIAGASASTGSQSTPSPDAGAYPLYLVTVANSGAIRVAMAAGAPDVVGLNKQVAVTIPASGGASTVVVGGNTLPQFTDGSVQAVNLQIPLDDVTLNPFEPIKLKLSISSTTGSNAAVFKASYLGLAAGDSVTTALTDSGTDTVGIGSANAMTVTTTVNAVIPTSAFAGFDGSNVWSVTKQVLLVQLSRVGNAGGDTNGGDITLLSVVAVQ